MPFRALICAFYGIVLAVLCVSAQLLDGPFQAVALGCDTHLSSLPGNPASARGLHLSRWGVYFLFDLDH